MAQDDKPSTVLVVRVPGDENIVRRLRAELSSYRFRVVELPPAKRAEALAQLADERAAHAALRAKPDAMAVEVWVRPSSAGAPTNEELVNAGPGRDATVLAVRVTEAMRARGLALPPLLAATNAAAADSGKRATPPVGGPGAPKPTAAADPLDDVEPARPTELPADAVPPSAPSPDTKRAELDRERKADAERTADAERRTDAEHKPDAERRADAERRTDAERKSEAERKAAAERKANEKRADSERRSEEKRRADSERAEREADALPDVQPSSVATSSTQARKALLYAEVGPTGVWSPGTNRLGPALDVFVSVKFRPNQSSSISLVGLIPLLSTDYTSNDGTAVEVQSYGIGGFGDLHLPLEQVELNVGIGGMALFSSILPVEPSSEGIVYDSSESTQRLAALLGRVGASFSLTPDLRLSASVMVGLTVKDLRLQFFDASRNAVGPEVRWGTPLLTGTLSLELALPWDR